jgi:methyl-accepting chemotaxis protein
MNMILGALSSLRRGDATVRLPLTGVGTFGRVADVFNDLVEQNAAMAEEISRLSQVVGKEGKLNRRAKLPEARGFWAESVDCINALIDDLVHPTSEVARVIGAVAQGDLSKKVTVDVRGEILELKATVNTMVDQLSSFASEVTRVARVVGTAGNLGGQAAV